MNQRHTRCTTPLVMMAALLVIPVLAQAKPMGAFRRAAAYRQFLHLAKKGVPGYASAVGEMREAKRVRHLGGKLSMIKLLRSGAFRSNPLSSTTREQNQKLDEVVVKTVVAAVKLQQSAQTYVPVGRHALLLALQTLTSRLNYEKTTGRAKALEIARAPVKHATMSMEIMVRQGNAKQPRIKEAVIALMQGDLDVLRGRLTQVDAKALRQFDRHADEIPAQKSQVDLHWIRTTW
ncbi:MAG: hypothetical protein JRH20_28165 [Deltaproteobacteria bacterium]|nr:hypothetical protein [Deltaproteobacteria bacterium]